MAKEKDNYIVRGATTTGRVVSAKAKKTVVVERDITIKIGKYKRWARRKSRISAHNPESIGADVGDTVKIGQTRKISKTKAWVVMEILEKGEEE